MSESDSFKSVGQGHAPRIYKTPVCRGCAGTGVGQHVPIRTFEIIQASRFTWVLVWDLASSTVPPKARTIIVGQADTGLRRDGTRMGTVIRPFAGALRKAQDLLDNGFVYRDDCIPMDPAWSCSWCQGAGSQKLTPDDLSNPLRRRPEC